MTMSLKPAVSSGRAVQGLGFRCFWRRLCVLQACKLRVEALGFGVFGSGFTIFRFFAV